ncbi:MAG: PfkB family kinase, nonfunctional [Candidatus Jorgensenbacteria bacterium GW2011_GWA1_48_13]|uniref:PfkB family kinase, nonfunctional n=2 Tax=Candidatus Joergenseniibacteriota TaxID=1752739 RepID=A0A0G1W7U2_9BACT|nr:MAG: PfkB family kinase, nonfunctional [Candidatus Jorgensenbacteria bacterium GW2011_GWA1_48_13]KKU99168.1 MAG: PfkB family kinase, nonfunctional [Candidatus Jorgensenbacteria bacterium GW2011_GWC1_48_8]KKW14841.1 MAG: PfkB family kinase, nonfunctional [Candidatus Jorgensenbacteria bacterium GW2011_GWB1_50_10]
MFDVITIGTATRDVFLTSPFFKVLKDPKHLKHIGMPMGEAQCFALGAKIEVEQPILTVGGGAANAAVTFARQGLKTGAVIGVGTDPNGEAAVRELKNEKIRVFPVYDPKDMTGYSVILISSGGERTILHSRGASRGIKGGESVFKRVRTKWVYVSPGGIPIAAMQKIVMHFKERGAKIAMNPSKDYLEAGAAKLKTILRILDVVIVNREEASYLTGADYSDPRRIFKKFSEMVDGTAVMTDGPKGSYVADEEYFYRSGIFKEKKLIDRTGAGDAFGSGFVAGLIQKKDVWRALRLANANATSVVEAVGAEEGILRKKDLSAKRWQYLDMDFETL